MGLLALLGTAIRPTKPLKIINNVLGAASNVARRSPVTHAYSALYGICTVARDYARLRQRVRNSTSGPKSIARRAASALARSPGICFDLRRLLRKTGD